MSAHRRTVRGAAAQRGATAALATALLGLLSACGQMQVRSLATGAVEQPAYQLSGSSMAVLRAEAQRLCPNGADVLRQAQRTDAGHDSSVPDAWYGRWWQNTRTALAPENKQSQLTVLCQPLTGSGTLAKAPDPVAAAASAAQATAAADKAAAAIRAVAPVGEGDLRDGQSAALTSAAVRSTDAQAGSPVRTPKPSAGHGDTAAKSVRSISVSPSRAASAPVLSY